jgi:capsular polysaccharide transport system permease protein
MLSQPLTIQLRVLRALIGRELITRFGRSNVGALWLVLEPMMFTLGVAALWQFTKLHTVSAIPIVAFALTGYSSVLVWRNTAARCLHAASINVDLMYHRNVKVLDVFLSRVALEVAGASASFAILSFIFWLIGSIDAPSDPLLLMVGWLLLCWFGAALALCIGSLVEIFPTVDRVWHVLTYLMFPLSGAVFMVHWLPESARGAVLVLPMVHGVELVRAGFFGGVVPTYGSASYLAGADLLLTFIGLFLVRSLEGRIEPQ